VSKDVRIRGSFSKPKGAREQKSWGNNDLVDSVLAYYSNSLSATEEHATNPIYIQAPHCITHNQQRELLEDNKSFLGIRTKQNTATLFEHSRGIFESLA
jgi:hypothetical protein